jgi:hypothetical protein
MKRETKALMAVTAVMYFAIISHLVHTEPIAETSETVKFVKVKDWSNTIKGPRLVYLKHLYSSSK